MKVIQFLFALFFTINSLGQLTECTLFNITGISFDSVPNQVNVSIYCDTTTDFFATYPYIQSVINCNSDVFATGQPYWFGQSGAHTQVYTITTNNVMICSPMIGLFYYQTMEGNQLCTLTYDWNSLNVKSEIEEKTFVYPNPVQNELTVVSDYTDFGKEFTVYNNFGQKVNVGKITKDKVTIDFSTFSQGFYYLSIDEETIKIIKN